MNRTIALAYGITGLAVAAALVAIIGTTTGLFGSTPTTPIVETQLATGAAPAELAAPATANPAAQPAQPAATSGAAAAQTIAPGAPEIVYVDAPPVTGARGRDDDDDRDDRDDHERGEHRGARRPSEEHDDD